MKHGTITHPKTIQLSALLGVPLLHAVGILHALWEWAADACPDGRIPFENSEQLEQAVRFDGPKGRLLEALECAHLVDAVRTRCAKTARKCFAIHDWPEHCEYNVHNKLARAGKRFANGQVPNLSRLTREERNAREAFYESDKKRSANARQTLGKRARARAVLAPPAPCPATPAPTTETPLPPKGGLPLETQEPEQPAQPDAKPKKKKPEEAPAPYRQFTDEFCRLWKKEHGGAKYPFQRKDGPAAAAIWDYVEQDLVAAMEIVHRYFENTTPFFAGHPLTKLASNLSQFAAGESVPDFMKARMPTPAEIAIMAGDPPPPPPDQSKK